MKSAGLKPPKQLTQAIQFLERTGINDSQGISDWMKREFPRLQEEFEKLGLVERYLDVETRRPHVKLSDVFLLDIVNRVRIALEENPKLRLSTAFRRCATAAMETRYGRTLTMDEKLWRQIVLGILLGEKLWYGGGATRKQFLEAGKKNPTPEDLQQLGNLLNL